MYKKTLNTSSERAIIIWERARIWYENGSGRDFVKKILPKELLKWIESNYRKDSNIAETNCVYAFYFNGIPIYIGESSRTARRFIEHLYNMYRNPEYWGLTSADSDNITVDIKILHKGIIYKYERESIERKEIQRLKPLFQPGTFRNGRYDLCIPRYKRKGVIDSCKEIWRTAPKK